MAKKKPKFGQGINALLSNIDIEKNDKKEVVSTLANSTAMLPIDYIKPNPDQPRKDFDEQALEELSASIKTYGIIQPITVRRLTDKEYQIISGERRYQASKRAGLKEVPTFVRVANDQELLEMALVENIQREDLNPIEVATTYARLIEECKLTHNNLALRVGKNRSTISNYLRILKLPPDIHEDLRDGKITMGQVRPLAGIEDTNVQLLIHKEIIEKDLTARQIEALVKSYGSKSKSTKPAKTKLAPAFRRIEDNLTSHFGSKVALKRNEKGKGQIVINFMSDDDLNRLLDVLDI